MADLLDNFVADGVFGLHVLVVSLFHFLFGPGFEPSVGCPRHDGDGATSRITLHPRRIFGRSETDEKRWIRSIHHVFQFQLVELVYKLCPWPVAIDVESESQIGTARARLSQIKNVLFQGDCRQTPTHFEL